MKRAAIIILLSLHLIVILLGTNLIDFAWVPQSAQRPVSLHLALTGGHSYAFFSPDIPRQTIVRCCIRDSSGTSIVDSFSTESNSRDLRTNYLFQFLCNEDEPETAARIVSRLCFKKYPHTESVKVTISKVVVPSVQEYETGKRNTEEELYSEQIGRGDVIK